MAENLPQGVTEGTISLVLGHPDPALLPTVALRECMDHVLRSSRALAAQQYGAEQGPAGLIDFLVSKLGREESLCLSAENVLITAGSTGALDLLGRLFLGRGGVALVEAPSYRDSLHVLRDHGAELLGIPMDGQGLRVDALRARLEALRAAGRRASILYTIPNYQNPTGVTLIEARRLEILALAREHGFLIVEDDVYRELAFEGEAPPSFYALADGRGVLRIGSFSKTLAPGLRVGWLLGEPEPIRRGVDCGVSQMGGGASPFAAAAVERLCLSGRLEPHVARLREAYRVRRDVMLDALEREMPPGTEWTHPLGGFFIWVTLPEGVSALRLRDEAAKERVLFSVGSGFFADGGGERCLRLAFSFASPEQMREGAAVLGRCVRRLMAER